MKYNILRNFLLSLKIIYYSVVCEAAPGFTGFANMSLI